MKAPALAIVALAACAPSATQRPATNDALAKAANEANAATAPIAPERVEGVVDESGGTFSSLYFAVVGDTRPGSYDDTASYPAAEITRIYADIAKLEPKPLFVVSTGDYVFAHNGSNEAQKQLGLYTKASSQWKGLLFSAMGNHECDTITATNCAKETSNMHAFIESLVWPLKKEQPWYALHFHADDDPGLSAKLIVTACNAWSVEQRTFFANALAEHTTYTVVVRHEPRGDTEGPCVADEDLEMQKSNVDLLLSGHIHTFERRRGEVIVGNGGAPPSSAVEYGFATVALVPGVGFNVVQYDGASDAPVGSFIVKSNEKL